jgi:hypothetical protein
MHAASAVSRGCHSTLEGNGIYETEIPEGGEIFARSFFFLLFICFFSGSLFVALMNVVHHVTPS